MANSIRGAFPMPLHMTPVRPAATPRVNQVDRHFVDDLTRASACRRSLDSGSGASPESATASSAESASEVAPTTARIAIGARATTAPADCGSSAESPAPRHAVTGGATAPPLRDGDGNIVSTGTLSEDPHTLGMYVPPDFYHGSSYSPVFDQQNENGDWVATPRFEGQKIYSKWRGSLPDDFDPNARVIHDPLLSKQGPRCWKQDENGDWVRRPEGPEGVAMLDDGETVNSLDPAEVPDKS